jgi:hypothetical protein
MPQAVMPPAGKETEDGCIQFSYQNLLLLVAKEESVHKVLESYSRRSYEGKACNNLHGQA